MAGQTSGRPTRRKTPPALPQRTRHLGHRARLLGEGGAGGM